MKTDTQYIAELRAMLSAALKQNDWRAADRISAALTLALKASYQERPPKRSTDR